MFDGNRGGSATHERPPCEWIITLDKTYRLQEIRLYFFEEPEKSYSYRYAISTSPDGRAFVPLVDCSRGEWSGPQRHQFLPRPVRAIKLLGLYARVNDRCYVTGFEAYCIPPEDANPPSMGSR